MSTFIYCLCEPGTRTVRYVGKADNPKDRLCVHLAAVKRGSQTHASRWIRQLSGRPELFVIGEIPRTGWQDYERNVIAAARALGMALTNITDGGEGGSGPSPRKGKKISPEHRAALIGRIIPLETRVKLSVALKGREVTPETRAKLSATRNTSGFIGVSKTPYKKWQASFMDKRKYHYAGTFSKIEDAVFARALYISNYGRI